MRDFGWNRFRAAALVAGLAAAFQGLGAAVAPAQTLASGSVAGTATTSDGTAVRGASVVISGPARQTAATAKDGTFRFATVPPGIYLLSISKAGFTDATQDGIAVVAGATSTVNVQLVASSFSSLREIGRVSSGTPGRATINTGTGAIDVISNQIFVDQGLEQVTKALDETPGIVASRASGASGNSTNGADQATEVVPQIRGALPYETETLVDGHPVSVGSQGYFSPLYLNPALLQNVEIAKGPGVL